MEASDKHVLGEGCKSGQGEGVMYDAKKQK